MGEALTYYERYGPVARRIAKAFHAGRYIFKRALGLRPTVLVEIRWRLGDEVMALPIYEAISKRYGGARVVVLCTYPELLEGNDFVVEVNPDNVSPDAYVLLRDASRTENRMTHYAALAGVGRPDASPRLHCEGWTSPLLKEVPEGEGPLVALAAGATWPTKRWPMSNWRALGEELSERGCRVIELGHEGEAIGVGTSFAGRTSVRDAAALLREAELAVTNDSGLMHLALAAGTRTVGLFGPTDPEVLIRDEKLFHPIRNARECTGCWNGEQRMQAPGVCPLDVPDCMETISVDEVLQSVDAMLAAES